MESAQAITLSNVVVYENANKRCNLHLVECEDKDGTIHHEFGIRQYTYKVWTRRWVPVRERVLMPVSAWPTLALQAQQIMGNLPNREVSKRDQATETSTCDNSDATHSETPSDAAKLPEPQPEPAVVKVTFVAPKCPPQAGKSTGKPRGRPRKRPASPAVEPPVKRADTEHAAQQ